MHVMIEHHLVAVIAKVMVLILQFYLIPPNVPPNADQLIYQLPFPLIVQIVLSGIHIVLQTVLLRAVLVYLVNHIIWVFIPAE